MELKQHQDPRTPTHILAELALDLAKLNGRVTADDLRRLAPNAPNKSTNMGNAFRLLVKKGELVLVCFQPSQAPGNNGRRIGVYAPPIKPRFRACP